MEWWELITVFNTVCYWTPILFRSWWAWKVKRASRNSGSDQSNSDDSRDIERNIRSIGSVKAGFDPERIDSNKEGSK